ncbi:MAG TPA: protein-methionine-sulfoxide reductase catalytic subunit MsrP [Planctomycetales bacterium]|jgi:sulfoxide reductase catalytic subunit YedY|nr:protein-methionine-sulfoxide reductase catalytic subunit MsrP [Planctomycetales bacterium]
MANPWDLPPREVTPESVVLSRRRWLARVGLGGGLAAASAGGLWWWYGGRDDDVLNAGRDAVPTDLFPAVGNPSFLDLDRPLSAEASAARYCNFYEFSTTKQVWRWIAPFHPVPWTLEVSGLVAKPRTFDLDDLLHTFASDLEERAYRHRCVEAWAMAVPWTGFPLSALLRRVEPLPSARFVRFTTFDRPSEASRQANRSEPWPYTEGLTLAEAGNELAFLAVGMYGHPLLKQHGAPVRLVVPWKYGFKSAKSLARIELTASRPATFWNTLGPNEYDFTANVNPAVPHPRWSQASERMLGTDERRPTQPYNGYGEWVARLYS